MDNQVFFGKMVINALKGWSSSFGDDLLLRAIIETLDYLHGPWTDRVKKMREDWLSNQSSESYTTTYAPYDKLLTRDDVLEIVEEMCTLNPELANEFAVSSNAATISELLDLSPFETLLLDMAGRFYTGVEYDYHHVLSRMDSLTRFADKADRFACLFDVDYAIARDAINGFLVKSGIFTDKRAPKGFYSVNEDIGLAFTAKELTPDTIEEMLFPAMLSTKLTSADYPHLTKEISRASKTINVALQNRSKGTNVMLWGEPGTGKTELALAMAEENGWKIRAIGDISQTDTSEKSRNSRLASLKLATKILARDPKAVLLFDEMEDLVGKTEEQQVFSKAYINRIVESTPIPIIWTTNALNILGNALLRRMKFNIGFAVPPADARLYMWKKYSGEFGLELDGDTAQAFADTFDITPALIRNAAEVAGSTLEGEMKGDREAITEIVTAMDTLVNFGTKRKFTLPPIGGVEEKPYDASCSNTDRDLEQFTTKLLSAKPRFSLLLYGVSGSGKSQFGKELAKRMGKEILFKRASDILGMYVGENEQNIADAFREASREGKVLLIDEGDTFIRDRAKAVRSWEASMTNEMLCQMETMDQPFILTTNLKDDLDPASLRRFTFKLKFDYMKPSQAESLFKRYFGHEAPALIARQSMLTPGDYANVAAQADILGIDNADEICAMLLDEVKQKTEERKSIGF